MKIFISSLFLAFFSLSCTSSVQKPNVIIIYTDDVGYGDVSCNGAQKISTPNIDKLAETGLNFTDAHSSSSVCTPSRYSLLTGEYSYRNKRAKILAGTANALINDTYFTMPGMFRDSGYRTAIVGKWHLGLGEGDIDWNGEVKPGPAEAGFEHSFIIPATGDRVPCVYMENNYAVGLKKKDLKVSYKTKLRKDYKIGTETPEAMTYYGADAQHSGSVINGIGRIGWMNGAREALWDDEEMADRLVKETNNFITANKDRPFMLVFSSHDIHVPRVPNSRFKGKSQHGYRGDAMVQLDWCVGEIYNKCEALGILENTIIIFTSDNGPVYNDGYQDGTKVWKFSENSEDGHFASGPFNGGKYSLYEGGTRVPFIVSWKSHIQKNTKSKALVSQLDLIASFAYMLDVEIPEGAARDSKNFFHTFTGSTAKGRDFLIEQSAEGLSLRHGSWKYIPPAKYRRTVNTEGNALLFNLKSDTGERVNLAADYPEKVKAMQAIIDEAKEAGN